MLLPDAVERRSVRRGQLGCPVCQRTYGIVDGVAWLSQSPLPAPVASGKGDPGVDAGAVAAFLGLGGPGGYVALVGTAARFAPGLQPRLEGVHLALVNPEPRHPDEPGTSVLHAPLLPFRTRSLRGVVLGGSHAADPAWQADAFRAVLPGLRVAGESAGPVIPGVELLGSGGGWWVGRAETNRR